MSLVDGKAALGTVATMTSASTTWINTVEPIVTIVVTIVVGGLTAWYTWERAMKLRRERKENR